MVAALLNIVEYSRGSYFRSLQKRGNETTLHHHHHYHGEPKPALSPSPVCCNKRHNVIKKINCIDGPGLTRELRASCLRHYSRGASGATRKKETKNTSYINIFMFI